MTAKFDKFKEELIALCDEHEVMLWSTECLNNSECFPDPRRVDESIEVCDKEVTINTWHDRLIDYTKEQKVQPAHSQPTQPPHQIT